MRLRVWQMAPLLAAGAIVAVPAGAAELSLERAVALALAQNPGLKAVEEQRSEVAGGIREARADAFPQLALTSAWSRSRNPSLLNSPDFDEFLENFPGGEFTPREQELSSVGMEVTQPLFTFGKISAAVDLAEQVAEVTEAQIDTARLDTALAAAQAYYQVLAAREALATVEQQERSRRESLEVVQARFDIGEATRLELLQSQSTLAQLLPDLAAAQGELEQTQAALRTVLDLPPGEPLELEAAEPAAVAAPGVPELPTLLEIATERRPELADLTLQQLALESQQQVTRAEGRPQLELTGRYGRQAREAENLPEALFQDWIVVVGMRWEFLDGGRRQGQIAQLESRQRQLEWQQRDLLNLIRLELEQARTDYQTALARRRAAEISAGAAREAARVAEESYREGVALQADWLASQQREIEAELVLVDAYYDTRIEAARLARALGYLPTEDFLPPAAAVAGR